MCRARGDRRAPAGNDYRVSCAIFIVRVASAVMNSRLVFQALRPGPLRLLVTTHAFLAGHIIGFCLPAAFLLYELSEQAETAPHPSFLLQQCPVAECNYVPSARKRHSTTRDTCDNAAVRRCARAPGLCHDPLALDLSRLHALATSCVQLDNPSMSDSERHKTGVPTDRNERGDLCVQVRAVIVENTFISVSHMVDELLPALSSIKGLVLRMRWDAEARVRRLQKPILFISGSSCVRT